MDVPVNGNLVGAKLLSPPLVSTSTTGCSQETSPTRFIPKLMDITFEGFPPATSANNLAAGTIVDGTTILETQVGENVRKRTKLSLTPVDVSLPKATGVNIYETWPWSQTMNKESTSQLQSKDHLSEHFKQQQLSEGVQDVIEFLQPPLPYRRIAESPFFNIFCNQSCPLTKSKVDFTIQVLNLSPVAQINSTMFEAVVTDPLDEQVTCVIRRNENSRFHSFNGSFYAEEDGVYEVRVILVTPIKIWSLGGNNGVVLGSLDIPVSRPYGEESRKDALVIQCEFERDGRRVNTLHPQPSQSQERSTSTRRGFPNRHECKLWGLAADLRTNNLFYSDRGAHEVICVHPAGQTLFKFGQQNPSAAGQLRRPTGIAYDGVHRRLIVADKDNHRICFYTIDGLYISSFGSQGHENGKLHYPWDVSVSPDGQHIAVADSRNKRIQLFDRFGNFLNKYSIFEKNPFEHKTELDYPRGISFDESGTHLYVTDFNVNNVIQIPLDFSYHRKMIPQGQLCRPQGITVDWLGNLLIVDSRNHCVRQVTTEGDLVSSITRVPDMSLNFPVNVTSLAGGFAGVLDGTGKIFIF